MSAIRRRADRPAFLPAAMAPAGNSPRPSHRPRPAAAPRDRVVGSALLALLLLELPVGALGKVGKMALLFPVTFGGEEQIDPAFLSLTCGAQMAVHHVNTRDEVVVPGLGKLVQNITLNFTLYDTGFVESVAIQAYRRLYTAGDHVIVGAGRSAVSIPLALFGAIDQIPQVCP